MVVVRINPTGSTNSMAIMVEYDNDTPNFDVEADKVIKHADGFKHPGEWKDEDLGTGAGNKSQGYCERPINGCHKINCKRY